MILEVCIGSVTDALEAKAGGADRLELCSALELGGLTPSSGLVRGVTQVCDLPVIAMIRPRPGGFCYDNADFRVMIDDVEQFREAGVAGFAFGILTEDGEIDIGRCYTLMEHMLPLEPVFHRAFDLVPDPEQALEQLIEMGVKRVLSSGKATTAPEGAEQLTRLVQQAGDRIEILPGAGVRPDNIQDLLHNSGCWQVHGTFRKRIQDRSACNNSVVSYGLPSWDDPAAIGITDRNAVSTARQILNSM